MNTDQFMVLDLEFQQINPGSYDPKIRLLYLAIRSVALELQEIRELLITQNKLLIEWESAQPHVDFYSSQFGTLEK